MYTQNTALLFKMEIFIYLIKSSLLMQGKVSFGCVREFVRMWVKCPQMKCLYNVLQICQGKNRVECHSNMLFC